VLLVIFGAGASYDSVPHLPPPANPTDAIQHRADLGREDRPPLANQLFENRPEFVRAMEQFKACLPLIPQLRKPGIAVEQELARVQEQAEVFPTVHRELAAIRYYLHLALWQCQRRWHNRHQGITNYATLLREIERWRFKSKEQVCYVTFNYDTMLEEAMWPVLGFEIRDLSGYTSLENYSLIKLHGSVNWGRELDGIGNPGNYDCPRLIAEAADLKMSGRYRLVGGNYPMLRDGLLLVTPALAIPVDKKDEFSCPDTHVKALAELLPNVTKTLVIGWRATETKFLQMLNSRLTGLGKPIDVMIVSDGVNGAGETFRNLMQAGLHCSRQRKIEKGFTGLIHQLGLLEAFLRY